MSTIVLDLYNVLFAYICQENSVLKIQNVEIRSESVCFHLAVIEIWGQCNVPYNTKVLSRLVPLSAHEGKYRGHSKSGCILSWLLEREDICHFILVLIIFNLRKPRKLRLILRTITGYWYLCRGILRHLWSTFLKGKHNKSCYAGHKKSFCNKKFHKVFLLSINLCIKLFKLFRLLCSATSLTLLPLSPIAFSTSLLVSLRNISRVRFKLFVIIVMTYKMYSCETLGVVIVAGKVL